MTNQLTTPSAKKPFITQRTLVLVFTVLAAYLMLPLRYNLSVAIIAILDERIDSPSFDHQNSTNQLDDGVSEVVSTQRYDFDDLMVGLILSSYFYGYIIFQVPAGRLSEVLGSKWLLGIGTLISGIASMLTPVVLDWSPIAMIICRVMLGIGQSSIVVCSYTLYNEWFSKEQRSNAITLLNVGFEIGCVSGFYFTGFISTELDWRYSFYLFGLCTFIWFVPFCLLISSTPDDDKRLSEHERQIIEKEQAIEYSQDLSKKKFVKIPPKCDWKLILTSPCVWASACAKIATGIGYYTITIRLPAYLDDRFDLLLESNGNLNAITAIGILSSKTLCLFISNYLLGLNLMTLTNFRKTFQSIAMLTPAVALFTITIMKDDLTLIIIAMFIAMFGMGFVCMGDNAITAEFAKDLSGSVFGFTNMFGCVMGVCAPMISATFLEMYPDDKLYAWNLSFYVASLFLVIGSTVFITFASAETQKWAEGEFKEVRDGND